MSMHAFFVLNIFYEVGVRILDRSAVFYEDPMDGTRPCDEEEAIIDATFGWKSGVKAS